MPSPPNAQAQPSPVARGPIRDAAVGLGRILRTYRKHAGTALPAGRRAENSVQAAFAHGFMTLVQETKAACKNNKINGPSHDGGLQKNDPELPIGWPRRDTEAVLSTTDAELPPLSCLTSSLAHN